jgi:hypothetical protein
MGYRHCEERKRRSNPELMPRLLDCFPLSLRLAVAMTSKSCYKDYHKTFLFSILGFD